MKKLLEYPYSKDYTDMYVYFSNQLKRMCVSLHNTITGKRLGTSYARYLMSVKMGRYLNDDGSETVDHIDNDPTNDDINNLQILSQSDNIKKYSKFIGNSGITCTPEGKTLYNKNYYQENKDLIKEYRTTYYRKNNEAILKQKSIYSKSHKEEKKEYDRIYYLKNKQAKLNKVKEYAATHKEEKKEYSKKYHAIRKLKLDGK